jgi:1-deoxy-D-xylulose-5-phosphate reductoisomerase
MGIPRTIEEVLAATPASHPATIAEVLEVDAQSRERAHAVIAARAVAARKDMPVRA